MSRPRNLLEAIERVSKPGMKRLQEDMPEKVLANKITKIITDLNNLGMNLLWYHPNLSIRDERGFPDLTIIGQKVIFRELKKEKGRIRPEQQIWLARLQAAGHDAGIWRPSDLTSSRIVQELRALGKGNP